MKIINDANKDVLKFHESIIEIPITTLAHNSECSCQGHIDTGENTGNCGVSITH